MSRPGKKPPDPTIFLAFFFTIFGLAGVFMLVTWGMTTFGVRSMTDDPRGALAGGLICSGVALFGVWLISSLRKNRNRSPLYDPTQPPLNRYGFPQPKQSMSRGPGGGIQLQLAVSRRGQFIGLVLVALFWNGIVSVFLREAFDGGAGIGIILGLFLVPFVLVGLFLIFLAGHQMLLLLRVPATVVEVSSELLAPGESARVRLYQRGGFPITRASIDLMYRESATHGSGDDQKAYREELVLSTIATADNLYAADDRPILSGEFSIPQDAMHSFKSIRHGIEWFLRVKLDIPGRPDVKEDLTIRVGSREVRG